jgi:LmbE family N-acetylglucosaminyl deacetylase
MSNPQPSTPGSTTDQSHKPTLKRWITRLVIAPMLLVLILASILAYKIHAGNKAMEELTLPSTNPPLASSSILVFSPHPDDETLGTGGLIQQTLAAGGKVHIVFMTNGDAFRVGVSDYYKIVQVKPTNYIRYGQMRQREALTALSTLGLPATDVVFLGYADRGLMGMWEMNWLPTNPWQSPYSRATRNPYPNSPSYRKPYCGTNVLADVEKQIVADHPTDIYVTHPSDDHPDHCASAAFVEAAVQQLEDRGTSWVNGVRVHFFLIHRGDWPVPQGLYPTLSIGPPAAFVGLDTHWNSLKLTGKQTSTKQIALNSYVSQEEMMSRFLVSFVRKNEIFGELPKAAEHARLIQGANNNLVAYSETDSTQQPVAKDPIGDSVLRDFQPAGDITAIYVAKDNKNLYIHVAIHARLSRTVSYHLSIRPFDGLMNTTSTVIAYGFSPRRLNENDPKVYPGGATATWKGADVYYVVPLRALHVSNPSLIFVQASTTFARVVVDHTGYRPVYLQSAISPVPLS